MTQRYDITRIPRSRQWVLDRNEVVRIADGDLDAIVLIQHDAVLPVDFCPGLCPPVVLWRSTMIQLCLLTCVS